MGRHHRQHLATWLEDAVDLLDDRHRRFVFVEQAGQTDHVDGSRFGGESSGRGVEIEGRQATQLEVAANERELVHRGRRYQYLGAVASVADEVGAEADSQPEQAFSLVLAEL